MKKKAVKKTVAKAKGFFRAAGEVLGSIGHELAEGKDKVVEASHTVMEGISSVISPAKKKATSKKVRKVVQKIAAKKPVAKKVIKKIVKKAAVKKAVSKTKKSVVKK